MKTKEIIKHALYNAIDWQTGLADADPENRHRAQAMEARYRKILKRRYGVDKTPMERMGEGSKSVSIFELMK